MSLFLLKASSLPMDILFEILWMDGTELLAMQALSKRVLSSAGNSHFSFALFWTASFTMDTMNSVHRVKKVEFVLFERLRCSNMNKYEVALKKRKHTSSERSNSLKFINIASTS